MNIHVFIHVHMLSSVDPVALASAVGRRGHSPHETLHVADSGQVQGIEYLNRDEHGALDQRVPKQARRAYIPVRRAGRWAAVVMEKA
jgi:hypothetical protein